MIDQDQLKFNKSLNAYLLNRKGQESPDLLLGLWRDLYRAVESKKAKLPPVSVSFKKDFEFAKFKESKLGPQYALINFLKEEISRELGTVIKTFFLQGSFAEGDALENWSDLDIMLVFNEKLFQSRDNLIFARKVLQRYAAVFYKIDPLNHHRFQLITSIDLDYYPQSFLPLPAWKGGLRLAGDKELTVRAREDAFEKSQDLLGRAKHLKKRLQVLPENLAEFKMDLSHLFLLPSLLLQLKGIYVPKKLSFERAKKKFPKLNFGVVDEASAVRQNWRSPNLAKYYPNCFIKHLPLKINDLAISSLAVFSRWKKVPLPEPKLRDLIQRSSELYETACRIKI